MKKRSDGRILGNQRPIIIQNTLSRLKHLERHRSSNNLLKITFLEKEIMGEVELHITLVSFLWLTFRNLHY